MAFVNAYLTKEERTEFKTKAIPSPHNRFVILDPMQWTINREQDVFLVRGGQDREGPYDYYFLLGWKGAYISVELREYWVKGSPRTWELIRLELPEHLKNQQDAITQNLKDALTVWAFNGNPDEPFNQINQNTLVQFKF